MKFKQISRYFWRSECGGYTISKLTMADDSGRHEYKAWLEPGLVQIGGPYTNARQAIEACEMHKGIT